MKNEEKNGLPEIYRFFKKKFTLKERNNSAFIDYCKFSSIIKEFNQELSRMIIEENIEFKMPLRLGFVRIRKYKRKIHINDDGSIDKKGLSPNWKETKLLWKKEYPGKDPAELKLIHNKPIIYYLNEHTDGYKCLLYWNKKGSNAINRSIYSMIFAWSNNRHLANILQGENKIDYYE